jgi:enoyl-CoA hydratase/carnithine racemase
MRMMILGRHESIGARKALEIGLVSEVVEPNGLRDRAIELATLVASNSPAAVEQAIRAMWETLELPLSEALEASLRRSASMRGHPDQTEGPLAWREKREPKWAD